MERENCRTTGRPIIGHLHVVSEHMARTHSDTQSPTQIHARLQMLYNLMVNTYLYSAVGGGPWRMLGGCTWYLLGPSGGDPISRTKYRLLKQFRHRVR